MCPRCRQRGLTRTGGYLWDGETSGGMVSLYRCSRCGARLRGNGGWSDAPPDEWEFGTGASGRDSLQVQRPRGPLTAETIERNVMVRFDTMCDVAVAVIYEPLARSGSEEHRIAVGTST